LLGPFGAAAYRLVALANTDSDGRFDAAQRLLDWLPSRVLLLTLCVLGDFDRSKGLLAREALDTGVTAETLLAQGVTRAWRLDDEELDDPRGVVTAVETAQKAMNRATGVWVVVASLLALL
jgi:membrane protein required for beta-lactamase induction